MELVDLQLFQLNKCNSICLVVSDHICGLHVFNHNIFFSLIIWSNCQVFLNIRKLWDYYCLVTSQWWIMMAIALFIFKKMLILAINQINRYLFTLIKVLIYMYMYTRRCLFTYVPVNIRRLFVIPPAAKRVGLTEFTMGIVSVRLSVYIYLSDEALLHFSTYTIKPLGIIPYKILSMWNVCYHMLICFVLLRFTRPFIKV